MISGIGLSPDTKIKYEGDLENNHQPLSEEGQKTAIDFGQIRTITVVVDEEPDPHAESVRSLDTNLEEDVFLDPRYGLKITPVCETFDTKLTLNFRSASKDEVRRLIQRLRTRINTGHGAIATGGEFSYPIPHNSLQAIIDVYNTAIINDEDGAGKIDEYFKNNLADWITITAKQNGKGAQFTARKQVSGIHLIYDHDEPQYDKKETNYVAGFTVSFKLERPTELRIEYPLIVAGSPMPEGYWPDLEPPWIVPRDGYKNPLIESEQAIDNYVLSLPWHYTVDYNGASGRDTAIIFSSDCAPNAIDPSNPDEYLLLNLHELPFDLTPTTWEYLARIAENDKHMTTSILRVCYHISGVRVESASVWLDSEMRVWSNAPYEVWKRNQFTLELITDVGTDNNKIIDSLRPFPDLLKDYVVIVAPEIIVNNPHENKPAYPSHPGSPGYPTTPTNPSNPGYKSPGGVTRPPSSPDSPETIDWEYVLSKPFVPVDVLDQVVIGITKQPARMQQLTIHNNTILVMKAG